MMTGRYPEATNGRRDGPFATLERARQEIRELAAGGETPISVFIREGIYRLSRPLRLYPADSGTHDAPVLYRSFPGEVARIAGGMPVRSWTPVDDPEVLSNIDRSAKGHLVQADLKELGLDDFGRPDGPGLELFFQDRRMTLACYPNEGFMRIKDVADEDGHQIHGISGSKTDAFYYERDRPARWTCEKGPWLHGYWFWDWSDERQRVESIDTNRRLITLHQPHHHMVTGRSSLFMPSICSPS